MARPRPRGSVRREMEKADQEETKEEDLQEEADEEEEVHAPVRSSPTPLWVLVRRAKFVISGSPTFGRLRQPHEPARTTAPAPTTASNTAPTTNTEDGISTDAKNGNGTIYGAYCGKKISTDTNTEDGISIDTNTENGGTDNGTNYYGNDSDYGRNISNDTRPGCEEASP